MVRKKWDSIYSCMESNELKLTLNNGTFCLQTNFTFCSSLCWAVFKFQRINSIDSVQYCHCMFSYVFIQQMLAIVRYRMAKTTVSKNVSYFHMITSIRSMGKYKENIYTIKTIRRPLLTQIQKCLSRDSHCYRRS